MGIALIAVITALEIALVVLTLTKQRESGKWLRNRLLTRAVEMGLVLAVILLPFTNFKWRFYGALITLAVLLLIVGLKWLFGRKKAIGEKRKSRVVMSAVLTVLLLLPALVPAFLFTNYNGLETTGAYDVKECSAILIDAKRSDPFETDGSSREVPVHFYYPETEGSFPLVVFSHGAFGYYQSNFSTYAELASHGYVVAALDHPHHAFFTKDAAGRTILVDMQFMNDALSLGEKSAEESYALFQTWMELRTADMNFVLDTIESAKSSGVLDAAWHTHERDTVLCVLKMTDTDHIGVMGHSMGGATAVAMGRTRSDIDAVVVFDGTWLTEITGLENGKAQYCEEPYPVPVLDFSKQSDYIEGEMSSDETGFWGVNDYEIGRAVEGKKMIFDQVGHMDFTDLPLISPFLAKLLGSGDADKAEFMTRINGIALNWFDHYLKGKDVQAD